MPELVRYTKRDTIKNKIILKDLKKLIEPPPF